MKTKNKLNVILMALLFCTGFARTRATLLAAILALPGLPARADAFGSRTNSFSINSVEISNPGNSDDLGAGGGSYSGGHGGVDYIYRIGVTEAPQEWITKATRLGLSNVTAGAWSDKLPAANMTWYEAAAFVNWLNTSKRHQAANDLTYTNGWRMSLWSSAEAWQSGGQNLDRHKDDGQRAFQAAANQTYTVEWCAQPAEGAWRKLADVMARPVDRIETVTDSKAADSGRFHRVVTPRQP